MYLRRLFPILLAFIAFAMADDSVTDADISHILNLQATGGLQNGSACACIILTALFGSKFLYPDTDSYIAQATFYWDKKEALSPACILIPTNANDVAKGVVTLGVFRFQFAIRSGGHMPVSSN
jgi:hypothetical protein